MGWAERGPRPAVPRDCRREWPAYSASSALVVDGVGWHRSGSDLKMPDNITLVSLWPYNPEMKRPRQSKFVHYVLKMVGIAVQAFLISAVQMNCNKK